MFAQIDDSRSTDLNALPTGYFYGSRLFLKFFFWFWLIGLISAVFVGVYAYYFHIEPEMRFFDQVHLENLKENAAYMAESFEKEGPEGAATFALRDLEWFYDENLTNVLRGVAVVPNKFTKEVGPGPGIGGFFSRRGHPKGRFREDSKRKDLEEDRKRLDDKEFESFLSGNEKKMEGFARKILLNQTDEAFDVDGFYFQGCFVMSESGKKYVAIQHLPWKRLKKHMFMLRKIYEVMPVFLFISAILCFSLGKYMARPIVELREASKKFAAGQLNARVGSNTENRHDEIGDLASDFNLMAKRLESMINGQHKLLGDISHELRSPLARLQVAQEILEKKSPDTDRVMLLRMATEISRLNDLIGKVLEINRIGSHEKGLEKSEFDLGEVLKKICSDGQFESQANHVEIDYSFSEPVKIMANQELIEQAIENILRNAIKYSPQNSQVHVGLTREEKNGAISITVIDSGPGIPEEHLNRIFEPFFRCHDDRDRKTGGVGLGLSIAQKAVSAHHGTICLTNLAEGGLKAEIVLPLT